MTKYVLLTSCAALASAVASPALAQSWDDEVTAGSYDTGVYSDGYGAPYDDGSALPPPPPAPSADMYGGGYGADYDAPSGGSYGGTGDAYSGAYSPDTGATYSGGYGGDDGGATVYPDAYANATGITNSRTRPVQVTPYIEFSQIAVAELSPGNDVATYSQVAAGVDTTITGRNNGGSVSLRYERGYGWGDAPNTSSLSGVARGYASIVPQVLTVEAGGLAARTRVDGSGAATPSTFNDPVGTDGRVYSAFIGPDLNARAGYAQIEGNYRLGYNRVETPDGYVPAPGAAPVDIFDDSITHSANLRIATKPGEPLPVGLGTGVGFYQEDSSTLDQRVRDVHIRSDVTVPVGSGLAVVGGIGYEDVQVSSRNALVDQNGDPVLGADGRLQTDPNSPRQIAYDTSGLIWDAGVIWRPSARTALEAHVGRRYDSMTYYGSFGWQPSNRSSLNVSVYDGIQGFGGRMSDALADLPSNFNAVRNPVTGQINGCVSGADGAGCVNGVLGSVRSAAFRSRGIAASYGMTMGQFTHTFGAGYDRRTFIAPQGTVLAAANGLTDETYWLNYGLGAKVGRNGGFDLATYANWFNSDVSDSSAFGLGSSAAYSHNIYRGLSARAAVAYDFLDSDLSAEDIVNASALFGLRYNF